MDIHNAGCCNPYFDCNWWSDFSHERECLFIGGIESFMIKAIQYVPANHNYKQYVTPITMLQKMIRGFPIYIRKPSRKDVRYLYKLISEECPDTILPPSQEIKTMKRETPTFVKSLFHHFCINVTNVKINYLYQNTKQWCPTQFGFKIFSSLFMVSQNNIFNISLIVNLFKNMEEFVLFDYGIVNNKWQYVSSIKLNDEFCVNIIETLKILNHLSSLALKLRHLIFIKPSSSIATFIKNNQQKFNSLKWCLSQKTYKDKYWRNCDESLFIEPLNSKKQN